jgi:competence protein ComEC
LLTGDISMKAESQVITALDPGTCTGHAGATSRQQQLFQRHLHHRDKTSVRAGIGGLAQSLSPSATRYAGALCGCSRSRCFNTAEQGAMPVNFPADGEPERRQGWRQRDPRYWRE